MLPPQSDAAFTPALGGMVVSGRIFVALALAAGLAGPAWADDKPSCALRNLGLATVRTVVDGHTVVLADGREVRLAGIEVPDDDRAKAALDAAVSGRNVILAAIGPETDRYGRLVAVLFPDANSTSIENSAQSTLLAAGMAQVAAHVGQPGCAALLRQAERPARTAGLGLWTDPHYLTRKAEDPSEILGDWGRFVVVEGKVVSVRESGGTIYVNFGRRWSEDFTVTVPKRSERSFAALGLPLKKLAGRHVRIRGTIEERGGPWIEANTPEQIEVDGD